MGPIRTTFYFQEGKHIYFFYFFINIAEGSKVRQMSPIWPLTEGVNDIGYEYLLTRLCPV